MGVLATLLFIVTALGCSGDTGDSEEPGADTSDTTSPLTDVERQEKILNCQDELRAWYDSQEEAAEGTLRPPPQEPNPPVSEVTSLDRFERWCGQFESSYCNSCITELDMYCNIDTEGGEICQR